MRPLDLDLDLDGAEPDSPAGPQSGAAPQSGAGPQTAGRLARWVVSLPDLLVLAVAAFSVPTLLLLVLGQFHTPLVLGLGAVAVVAAVAVVGFEPGEVPRRDVLWTGLALLIAAGASVYNGLLSAQNIVVARDPAMYATTAQYLASHSSLPIPTGAADFPGVAGLVIGSPGFQASTSVPGAVDPQGNHLVQALIALVGDLLGPAALLRSPALLGGLALLAVFAIARRVAGGGPALVAVLALGASMPMLHFVRAVYTEPIALAFTFGGLSLLWRAQTHGRLRDAAGAGLVIGAVTMTRIDGYVSLLFVMVLIITLFATAVPGRRRVTAHWVGVLVLTAAVPIALSAVDLRTLAPGYTSDLGSQLRQIQLAYVGLLVLGVVVVAIAWRTRLLHRVAGQRWLAPVAVGGMLAVFAVLASRPWWLQTQDQDPQFAVSLPKLQHNLGLPVDGTRGYDELSVSWLSWYYGWPMLVLAAAGLGLMLWRLLRRGDLRWLPVVVLTVSVALLYFVEVSISPDQIWAVRRFLPVVIPGALVAAVLVISVLWRRGGLAGRLLSGALGVVVVAVPVSVSSELANVREYVPQLAQLQGVCAALPADAAVLFPDLLAGQEYAPTIRAYCNVPAVQLDGATPETLAKAGAAAASRGRVTWVVATRLEGLPLAPGQQPLPFSADVTKWNERLLGPPVAVSAYTTTLYVGQVGPDGLVMLADPPGA